VDAYIADLRAVNQMGRDIKIFCMHCLGIPQDRIAKRMGLDQKTIHYHLGKMPVLANSLNADLSRGFTVAQVAEKHGWPDPMAGGGVTPDTCLAMGRRCWAFDMKDRPDTRPEIEPFTWGISSDQQFSWPVSAKEKPDLIIFDPPYFDKKAADYDKKSISGLPKKEYLAFLKAFFVLLKQNAKKTTRMAFINADWRNFQNTPAAEERYKGGILIDDYLDILKKTGWYHTHIIQAPMSTQRFNAGVVSAMQKKNILGVISRYVIVLDLVGLS
jgi:hypothetical protein